MMHATYDKEADAAYLYVEYPVTRGQVKKSVALDQHIILDFDVNQKLLGIEILDASKVLSKKVLLEAKQPTQA